MSVALQAKFLRILEDGMVRRLGGKTEIKVDVRVLAATNKDPRRRMQAGTLPRGPLLPAERREPRPAAAARRGARTSRC